MAFIKTVGNYNLIVTLAEQANVDLNNTYETAQWVSANELKKEYKDFLTVCRTPSMIDDEANLIKYSTGEISKAILKRRMTPDKWSNYIKLISDAEDFRATAMGSRRNMQVVWITGPSGAGKSVLSRYLMDKAFGDGDYSISSGTKNLFDKYSGESGFILEEFRSSSMRFSELLAALDNDNNSGTGARYVDKDFKFCKQMIINSISTPQESYKMFEDTCYGGEPIKQLIRRLGYCYLYVNSDGTIEKVTMDDQGKETARQRFGLTMKTVFEYMDQFKQQKNDILNLLGSLENIQEDEDF